MSAKIGPNPARVVAVTPKPSAVVRRSFKQAVWMPERVVNLDLGVTWEPNAPNAALTAFDNGTTVLRLAAHPSENDQRDVQLVWSGTQVTRMQPPNDESIGGHRLYIAGLSDVRWIGEVLGSTLVAELERTNRVHPRHDPKRYASLRHWIVLLKECTVEIVGLSLETRRESTAVPSDPPHAGVRRAP